MKLCFQMCLICFLNRVWEAILTRSLHFFAAQMSHQKTTHYEHNLGNPNIPPLWSRRTLQTSQSFSWSDSLNIRRKFSLSFDNFLDIPECSLAKRTCRNNAPLLDLKELCVGYYVESFLTFCIIFVCVTCMVSQLAEQSAYLNQDGDS